MTADHEDPTGIIARGQRAGCPFFTDPSRVFDDLAAVRESQTMPWSDVLAGRVVTRYDDIVEVLHDPETYSSAVAVGQVPEPWRTQIADHVPLQGTLLGVDNPDHDRLREAVNSFFVPRRLARFESWIREQAHQLVDEFAGDGEVEIKTAFGLPLALRVISRVVGLDPERAEWYGRALSFFQGPRDVHHPGTPDEKVADLLELHELIRETIAERQSDRRDDLISHVWAERDAGRDMTDFEMLSLFPGLMLAGHETSSNLICMALSHLLADRSRWDWAQQSDEHRARALEELIRYESAITGMNRRVTRDTMLGGERLREGDRLFIAHAAGSRDPQRFPSPDEIDFERAVHPPHLGFGQGVHACLGAPLARMLLRIELSVLHERLPGIMPVAPYEQRQYSEVAAGRGMPGLRVRWDARAAAEHRRVPRTVEAVGRRYKVRSRRTVAAHVVELDLEPLAGVQHVDCTPGAHVDIQLANGITRQYSVVDSDDDGTIRIAVLREGSGRGGSRFVHDEVRVGDVIVVGKPRNHFRMRTQSPFNLFVAGGIGVTPLLSMMKASTMRNEPWSLLYLGSARSTMAYLDELTDLHRERVRLWESSESGRYDLDSIWEELPVGAVVYACGPESLLAALEDSAERHGRREDVVVERFAPRAETHAPNTAFDVELRSTGRVLRVPADRSVLDVINEAGAGVLSTCSEGTCGTCEVRVVSGVPEHRDSVLDPGERLANETMMVCVSRCREGRLVLDL